MKLKHLPWLFVVALAIATGLLYNSNQQQAAELDKLRSAAQELEQLRTSQADTKQSQAQAASEELTRLHEENKDVLRLAVQTLATLCARLSHFRFPVRDCRICWRPHERY